MNATSNMTDEQLVKGCIANDAIAQKKLFDDYSKKMMGVCLRYTNSEDEAQDVVQNGFIKVFEMIHTFKGSGSLEGWIRKIMVNSALDNYRKTKALKQNIEIENVDYMLQSNIHATESLETKDLLRIIQSLPSGFRTVFNLYAIEGYTHKEIAVQLNISENTSKSQYSRARVYLQKILKPENAL